MKTRQGTRRWLVKTSNVTEKKSGRGRSFGSVLGDLWVLKFWQRSEWRGALTALLNHRTALGWTMVSQKTATVCPIMLRLCPEIVRQNPTLNFLSRNYETLSRNCEILSRNYETASHNNWPFKNAKRRPRHCPSPFKDAQIDLAALKTSQTTDRIIETCWLDVLTPGHRRDTKGSENDVEWGDVNHSISCPTRLAKHACSVW